MKIEIDPGAGPCFGVERAINMAEELLNKKQSVFCVGDLIHNEQEIQRLESLGMKTIHLSDIESISDSTIMFRAHGEPPSSFLWAEKNAIKITDATCPIVQNLQEKIENTYQQIKGQKAQIVIFGKRTHPEIISLLGYCEGEAVIIETFSHLDSLDFSKPIYLFSQTTKYRSDYYQVREEIIKRLEAKGYDSASHLIFQDSSCKIVARRDEQLRAFLQEKDLLIFVSGSKSSNGRQLFQICKNSGIPSYFISHIDEIKVEWFRGKQNIGISGATSTPNWLLKKAQEKIEEFEN